MLLVIGALDQAFHCVSRRRFAAGHGKLQVQDDCP
jgi:hypothetical protein